ncbi:single-stranded DNA-binding protein [Novosphingobium sp. Leaf2]|uniref:single-stranded DNA-binding protein n=1 Tax=Novosphingobium sp. Leaf2 TaxID=1735670 RepID=UPI0006F6F7C8|nr:single-stranded DNA-binding protein [Novosphingobium sp. Leaf2]KQM18396.1 single-stranded DNA-binding protein [Novosphingobium sp. Leaf2]
MMSSLNQCQFIGNLGADVEVKSFQNGGRVANLRLACTEKWKDREGNSKEKTEWVSVAIFNDGLVGVAERYLRKGSKVFISGKLSTRKWQDQNGNDRYSTEIVLNGFDAKLVMLDGPKGGQDGGQRREPDGSRGASDSWGSGPKNSFPTDHADDFDDIPFISNKGIW